jgi:hypothetical protein
MIPQPPAVARLVVRPWCFAAKKNVLKPKTMDSTCAMTLAFYMIEKLDRPKSV